MLNSKTDLVNKMNSHIFALSGKNHDFWELYVMAKFTPAYLKKLEDLLEQSGYDVRYEKGNFKSNYCIKKKKKVVVINKFSVLESRIQSLLEIIQTLVANQVIQADLRTIGLKNPIHTNELAFEEPTSTAENLIAVDKEELSENSPETESSNH